MWSSATACDALLQFKVFYYNTYIYASLYSIWRYILVPAWCSITVYGDLLQHAWRSITKALQYLYLSTAQLVQAVL